MKHKVAELEGALLDIAVALAFGWRRDDKGWWEAPGLVLDGKEWVPNVTPERDVRPWSSEWSHGGPIIEREQITVVWDGSANDPAWNAYAFACFGDIQRYRRGPTPLIAAMRAYVASRFGDEIEL